jgi:hypothetical protein
MKIADKSDLKPTHQGLIAEILKASGNSEQSKESLFDEFSRTLDSIVSKLRKNNDSGQLPATESRFAHSEKTKIDKKQKDSDYPTKEHKREEKEIDSSSEQPLNTQSNNARDEIGNKKEVADTDKQTITKDKKNTKDCIKVEQEKTEAGSNLEEVSDKAQTEKLDDSTEGLKLEEQVKQESENPEKSDETTQVSVALPVTVQQVIEPEKAASDDESANKLDSQVETYEVTGQDPQQQHLSEQSPDKLNDPSLQKIEDPKLQLPIESELKPQAPELQESNLISEAVVKGSKTEDKDRSLEDLILEKLLVGQVDPKLQEVAASKTQSASGAIFDRVAQAISSNFAALAESVMLKNTVQNLAAKMPNQVAEIATQQAAQGLQTINPTGMLNGSKSAEFADRKLENKESMKSLPRSLEVRTMERVESALKEVARSKDGKTISVRLDPPELGTVKIDVTQRDGSIHARLVAESPQVTNLLKDKSQEVVQMLRKLGLNVDKVSVSVGGQPEQPSQQFNQQLDSQVNDRTGENANRNSSNRSRKEGNGQSANSNASRVQHQNLNGVVSDHWVA